MSTTPPSPDAPGTGREPNAADGRWLARACELAALCPPSETAFSVGAVIVAADGTEPSASRLVPRRDTVFRPEGITMRARRIARMTAGPATAVTAVAGLSLAAAGPAAAAGGGSWRAYGHTNPITSSASTWHCAGTVPVSTDVSAQVRAIRSSGGGVVQGAVIVRNNRSTVYSAKAVVDLRTPRTCGWVCGHVRRRGSGRTPVRCASARAPSTAAR